ncbi:MAG: ParA family protein [Henriciella sp.]|nr:ParA family protein [Henriciella sp.]
MSATIAAIANLKGGVGKSTTTLMLADGLAYYYGADVLVVDLDPQANSSQMLLTDRGLQMAFEQGKGVHHLIKQFAENEPPNIANLILPNAVTLEELRRAEERDERMGWVSILPAHTQLRLTEMELEEKLYTKGMAPSRLASYLAGHMEKALEPLANLYDVILIDTPPYLSPLARAGLSIANQYVTPTLADSVSIWGTKQFSDWIIGNVTPHLASNNFVVITRFRNTKYARTAETELKEIYLKDRTFGPTIPESVQALNAMDRADLDSYDTLRGKYGRLRGDVKRLSESFVKFLSSKSNGTPPKMVRD